MIKNLSHVSLMSNSLNKVKNFYVKKLGLKIIHEFRNEKNELYGYFLSSNKDTFLEIFKTKKKLILKIKITISNICALKYQILKNSTKKYLITNIKFIEERLIKFLNFLLKILKEILLSFIKEIKYLNFKNE